jgi:hypothetical protein
MTQEQRQQMMTESVSDAIRADLQLLVTAATSVPTSWADSVHTRAGV